MCKKILSICLSIAVIFGLIGVFGGCGADETISDSFDESTTEQIQANEEQTENNIKKANSVEELEAFTIKYVEDEINDLNTQLIKLSENIDTFDKYLKNIDEVTAFYEEVSNTSEAISIRLREYSVEYAEMLIESDLSTSDMYNAFDGMYDCIYEDATGEFYDGVYDGIIQDLCDIFYNGVISDGRDSVSYSEWYEIYSDAYELWYDTSSDCYEYWYDMQLDVYRFYLDVRTEIFRGDIDGAKEEIEDFKEDIEKLKA